LIQREVKAANLGLVPEPRPYLIWLAANENPREENEVTGDGSRP